MRTRPTRLALVTCLTLFASACGGGSGTPGVAADLTVTAEDFAYALSALNAMRAAEAPAAAPLIQDAGLDAYATASNDAYDADRLPHTYFNSTSILPSCPARVDPAPAGGVASENEGWTSVSSSNRAAIDSILAFFLAERDAFAPGHSSRAHYETIIDPGFNFVGISIKRSGADGAFLMTQEFCD